MAWRCILRGLGTFCTKFWREIKANLREIYINFGAKFALKFVLKLVRIYEMVAKFKGNFVRKFLVFSLVILSFFWLRWRDVLFEIARKFSKNRRYVSFITKH